MPSCTLAPLLMPQAPRSTSADRHGRVAQRRRTCTARRQSRQASPQRCPRCRPSHTGGQLRRHQLRPHSRFGRCVIATVTEAPVGEMRGLPPSLGRRAARNFEPCGCCRAGRARAKEREREGNAQGERSERVRAVDQVHACMRGGSLVCYFALAHLAPIAFSPTPRRLQRL
jgi:hypothetical protein